MTATTIRYTEVQGASIELHSPSEGRYWTGQAEGVDMPDVEFTTTEPYNKAGSLLRTTRFKDREVDIPIAIIGSSIAELRERVRALNSILNPRRGIGTLEVSIDGASARRLDCRYASGASGVLERLDDDHTYWQAMVLTFHAFDPLWYDPNDVTQRFDLGPDVAIPFFPMFDDPADVGPHFGTATTYLTSVINNVGDEIAWPIWTLIGPMSAPVIQSFTNGEKMDFAGLTIAGGSFVTIDTRRGYATAVDPFGDSVLGTLTTDSAPFGLLPGNNELTVTVTGAGAATALSFVYTLQYLSV